METNNSKIINQIKNFSIKQLEMDKTLEENIIKFFGEEALMILIGFNNKINSNTNFTKNNPLFDNEIEAYIALSLHDLGKVYFKIKEDIKLKNKE